MQMFLKRRLLLVAAILAALLLCSCNNNLQVQEPDAEQQFENDSELKGIPDMPTNPEPKITEDIAEYTGDGLVLTRKDIIGTTGSQSTAIDNIVYDPSELLSNDLESYQIQLFDSVYSFPMTLEDLVAFGWEIDEPYIYKVEPGKTSWMWFKNSETKLRFQIYNPDIKPQSYANCYISGVSTFLDDSILPESVYLPGGHFFANTTKSDVLLSFRQPDTEIEGSTVDGIEFNKGGSTVGMTFSKDGHLRAIAISNPVTPDGFVPSKADENVKMLYEAPSELGNDPRNGIVVFNGDLYSIPFPLSALKENGWEIDASETPLFSMVDQHIADWDETVLSQINADLILTRSDDGSTLSGDIYNPFDNACLAQNAIYGFRKFVSSVSGSLSVEELAGGIKNGISEEDLISILEQYGIEYHINERFTYNESYEDGVLTSESSSRSADYLFSGVKEYETENIQIKISISSYGNVSSITVSLDEATDFSRYMAG